MPHWQERRRPAPVGSPDGMSGTGIPDLPSPGGCGHGLDGPCQNLCMSKVVGGGLKIFLTLQVGFVCEETLVAAQPLLVAARPAVSKVHAHRRCTCELWLRHRRHLL